MKKYKVIVIILAILLACIFLVGFFYNYNISAMSKESEEVVVEIPQGTPVNSMGDILHEKGLIRNTLIFKIYVKLNRANSLKASTYKLNKNMNLKTIVNTLAEGNSYNPNEIRITIKEGLNIRKIAKVVEEETNNTYDDFMAAMEDTDYIDSLINEYWFLTDSIKNPKIYYPLEGYLFPETYALSSKDATVKEIIKTMLDEMGKRLDKYKTTIEKSSLTIHELITLASIVELEGMNSDDRAAVAGVFYNRLNDKITLGSDVTTYYAEKIDDPKHVLTAAELAKCNDYNTRGKCVAGLPVGPIANPGIESLEATINPEKHDYYYFVADCDGKTYLNKDYTSHYNTVYKLKREGKWSCYE